MSVNTQHVRSASIGSDRFQASRLNGDEYELDLTVKQEKLPNIVPEV